MSKKFENTFDLNKLVARGKNDASVLSKAKMGTMSTILPEYWTKLKSSLPNVSLKETLKNFDLKRSVDYSICPEDKPKKSKKPSGIGDKFKKMFKNFNFKDIMSSFKTMQSGGSGGRPMKFPYTYSAKIAQFPLKMYLTKQWVWKYYAISLVASFPLFMYFNKLANSPGNVAKWAEEKRKELEAHHH